MVLDPLPDLSANELEQQVLETWRGEQLFHRTLELTRDREPFVFYEGPPTANGRPGIHHVFARTIKDLICRYQTMLGRQVTRIAGWDTHGLPVEIEVEKALNISGKADIEKLGVEEFNRRCRESVFRYKGDWEALSERIGYWLDYDHPYVTYSNDYVESVWWLLKQLWERELLYRGHKVLPYCHRCGTTLSSHELALGYAEHRSPSIHVLFRLEGGDERYLLVWTTTPWTLPSNVAVAVNPDFDYVEIEVDGKRVIVEKTIAQEKIVTGATHGKPLMEFPVVREIRGGDLVGLRYEQLLDAVQVDSDRAFRVLGADFVTREEGTGLVHLAPAFGADDYQAVQREGLDFVNPVNQEGEFEGTSWEELNGKVVFDANLMIADRLSDEGKLFGKYEPKAYEHTYPFCWRCDSPLIYYARSSWFVRTTAFKEKMVELNNGVDWHPPEVGSGRFGEWLENNIDWALSRDRYWGTPLPVWQCAENEDHRAVIGSYAELAERLGAGGLPADFDPHKPYIDAYSFPCDRCTGVMRRVPEVIDAWFDSGSMPFAQWHYPFENQEQFERHYPGDFICEGVDQTRGWFYSLLAISAGVFEKPAYRHVIVNGLVLDPEGKKMSKRIGNVVNPWDAVAEYGADAVRLYLLASSQAWLPKRFDPMAIREASTGFLTRLRNTYNFLALYAESDGGPPDPVERRPTIDRWLLARLDRLVANVREAWSGYDPTLGTRLIMDFCDNDMSNWYVRVNRARFWAPDSSADPNATATLEEALATVTRLLAPAAPFVSDAIYRRIRGESVHLQRFPEYQAMSDEKLEEQMEAVRKLVSLARAAREDLGMRVRQPLAGMKVAVPQAVRGRFFDELMDLLRREVNVKKVTIVETDEHLVTLKGKANYRTLGKVYGKDTPDAARAVGTLDRDLLKRLEEGETVSIGVDGRNFEFRPEDVVVERKVSTDWAVQSDGPYVVALDPVLTDDLKAEGVARELVNRIQRLRKEAGYDYTTRIALGISAGEDVLAAVRSFASFIAGETLAKDLEAGQDLVEPDLAEKVDINGRSATVSLKRYAGVGQAG